jgi:hypothetical protein
MTPGATHPARRRVLALAGASLMAVVTGARVPAVADESPAYAVEIGDVTAKVGEPTVIRATLRARDGFRVLKSYNNRVIKLSAFDDGVLFERDMVPAELQDGALVFAVGLRATKPGKHPINGLFRVGYIQGSDEMAMVSVPLIANVTGTE